MVFLDFPHGNFKKVRTLPQETLFFDRAMRTLGRWTTVLIFS